MAHLNIRELLFGTPLNLRWTTRYSGSRCFFPETVAEHSYFVCFYSKAIADWVIWAGTNVQYESGDELLAAVFNKAVLHDLEESRSGDIHRPFKYSTPELLAAIKHAERLAFQQAISCVWDEQYAHDVWFEEWAKSKDLEDEAGCIVAFADFLTVISFVMIEGGSSAIRRLHTEGIPKQSDAFRDSKFDFIRPLVEQAEALVGEIFDERQD